MKTIQLFVSAILLGVVVHLEANAQKLYNFPFGAQAYTFRNHFPKNVAQTLDVIQKMGITELETSGAKGVSDEEYKKMCDARGIKVPSIGAGYDQLEVKSQDIITKAKIFGANYVMCAWIPHKGDNFTLEDAQKAIAKKHFIKKNLIHSNVRAIKYVLCAHIFLQFHCMRL